MICSSVGSVDPSASTFTPIALPSHVSRTTLTTHDPMTALSTRVPSASRPYTRPVDSAVTTVGHTQLYTTLRLSTRSVASVGPYFATSARTRQTFPHSTSSSDEQSALHLGSTCIYNIKFVSLF